MRNNMVLKSIYKALFRIHQNNLKIFFWSQMFFMSVYIINIKKSSGTRENIFKNGTGLILYIIIKLEQYLIIIPKL